MRKVCGYPRLYANTDVYTIRYARFCRFPIVVVEAEIIQTEKDLNPGWGARDENHNKRAKRADLKKRETKLTP
jgi:hypothetical protein